MSSSLFTPSRSLRGSSASASSSTPLAARFSSPGSPDGKTSDLVRKLRRVNAWSYRFVNHAQTSNGHTPTHNRNAPNGATTTTAASVPSHSTGWNSHSHGVSQSMPYDPSGHSASLSSSSQSYGGRAWNAPMSTTAAAEDASESSSVRRGSSNTTTAGCSTLPPPLASLAAPSSNSATPSGPVPVPHSFVEILLHDDFAVELRRRNYLVMEYVRGRLPLLLELVMERFDRAAAMELVVHSHDGGGEVSSPRAPRGVSLSSSYITAQASSAGFTDVSPSSSTQLGAVPAPPAPSLSLTPQQQSALARVALRILSGRTGEARGGALDAFNATCGPVWDALTANIFFTAHLDYVGEVTAVLQRACDQVESIVPFAMSLLPVRGTTAAADSAPSLSFSARAPGWLSQQISAACSVNSTPLVGAMNTSMPPPPEAPEALAEYVAARCLHIQHLLMTLEALVVAMAMIDTHSADHIDTGVTRARAGWSDDGLLGMGAGATARLSQPQSASHTLLHPQRSSHRLGDLRLDSTDDAFELPQSSAGGSDAGMEPDEEANQMLEMVSTRAIAAFTHAFLSTTTVQQQLVAYSEYHARAHGLCAAGSNARQVSPSPAPPSALAQQSATDVSITITGPYNNNTIAMAECSLPSMDPAGVLGTASPPSPGTLGTPGAAQNSTRDLVLLSPALRSARAAPLTAAEATGEEVMLALVLEKANSLTQTALPVNSPLPDDRSFGSEQGVLGRPPTVPLAAAPPPSASTSSGPNALPPLVPLSSGRADTADCPHCARFRVVETELTERVRENLNVLCLTTICCAAHDLRVAEFAIAYMDEQGPVFAAQATMLLAHVMTPELMAVHPPDSPGGKALEWTLSFVFGGCNGADVARVRRERRLRHVLSSSRRSDPFSLANSDRSSASDTPLSGFASRDPVTGADGADGLEGSGAQSYGHTLSDSATALRVEYVLAASFTRCHPLMTVMGVIAETNAYNCGIIISKAVMQYACTLSQTSASLLRGPLPASRWSTPFTEAMMQGLSELALHHGNDSSLDVTARRRRRTRRGGSGSPGANAAEDEDNEEAKGDNSDDEADDVDEDADGDSAQDDGGSSDANEDDNLSSCTSGSFSTCRSRDEVESDDEESAGVPPAKTSVEKGAKGAQEGGPESEPVPAQQTPQARGKHHHHHHHPTHRGHVAAATGTADAPSSHRTHRRRRGRGDGRREGDATPFSFMPGPRAPVTGTSPQEETETSGTRTRRRCHAVHWAKCVVLSARTLAKAGSTTISVPHDHFLYLHQLSKRLQRLLKQSNRAIVAAADKYARTGVAQSVNIEKSPAARDEGLSSEHGSHNTTTTTGPSSPLHVTVTTLPSSVLMTALVDTLQSAQSLPSFTQSLGRAVTNAMNTGNGGTGGTGGNGGGTATTTGPSTMLDAPSLASSCGRLLTPHDDCRAGSSSPHPLSCSRSPTIPTQSLNATVDPTVSVPYGAHSFASERHEQAFADSFCVGKGDLGELLEEAPAFVTVPLHEVVFASLFSVLDAIGDVLLCEKPRLNSIFANDMLTLLYEIRLGMMESAAAEDLFGVTSALSMTNSSAMAATAASQLNSHSLNLSPSFPFGGTRHSQSPTTLPPRPPPTTVAAPTAFSRTRSSECIVLFPEFYVVLLERGLRINDVVRRWRREIRADPNYPATGLLPLLQRVKGRIERLQMPSEAEQLATRGALRLLLGVSTQDNLRSLHGTVLHVDDLDVVGTRKEEMTPRLGVSASQDTTWAAKTRSSTDNLDTMETGGVDGGGGGATPDPLESSVDSHERSRHLNSSELPAVPPSTATNTTHHTDGGNNGASDALLHGPLEEHVSLPAQAKAGLDVLAAMTIELGTLAASPPPFALAAVAAVAASAASTPAAGVSTSQNTPQTTSASASAHTKTEVASPSPSSRASSPTLRRTQLTASGPPRIKHTIRLVGSAGDLVTMQQRSGGQFNYNLPPLRRTQLDGCPTFQVVVADAQTPTPAASSDDIVQLLRNSSKTSPAEPSSPRPGPHPLFSAQIDFHKDGAQWRPLESDWTVVQMPFTQSSASDTVGNGDSERKPASATTTTTTTQADKREEPKKPSKKAAVVRGDVAAGQTGTGHHQTAQNPTHMTSPTAESPATRAGGDADDAVLLPNTLRLLESGAFGATGGNWSFSFMSKADAAQWCMLDRPFPKPDQDDNGDDTTTTNNNNSGTNNTVNGPCAVPQKDTNQPMGVSAAVMAAEVVAATSGPASSHVRSCSTEFTGTRRAAGMRASDAMPHVARRRLQVSSPQPQRRARSQPCPTFDHGDDDEGTTAAHLLTARIHSGGQAASPPPPPPPPPPRSPTMDQETPLPAAPSATLSTPPSAVAATPPFSHAMHPPVTLTSSPNNNSSDGCVNAMAQNTPVTDMRARSPLLSMAAARKRSVSEFLRVLASDDADGSGGGGVAAVVRRGLARRPPLLSLSQQTPPELRSASPSEGSSQGEDDLST